MNPYSDPTQIATADQFKVALLKVRNQMSEKDLALLREHCRAPNHMISTAQLATKLHYSNHSAVNMHYGKLAHDIADALHYIPPPAPDGNAHWWRTLAYGNDDLPKTDDGHYQWIMRPELVQVLQEWKWA